MQNYDFFKDGQGVVRQISSGAQEETGQEKDNRTMRDPKNLDISYTAITKKNSGPETCNPKPIARKVRNKQKLYIWIS